jgi:hypothetical protein
MSWLHVILIIDPSMLVLDGKVQRHAQVLQDALEHNFYALINWCRAPSPSNVLPVELQGQLIAQGKELDSRKDTIAT